MTNALRNTICAVIGILMASTICFVSFDIPHPLHGLPYALAVALAINAPRGKGPSALTVMVLGLVLATGVYVGLTLQGLYKELFFASHMLLSLVTLGLCGCLLWLEQGSAGTATYDRFPPIAVVYGLLTLAALIMFPIGRGSDLFTPPFEIARRLIVGATLLIFYPGLVLALVLNFLKPRHVRRQDA